MKKYTTLLFDNDNTLLDFSRSEAAALHDVCNKFGILFSGDVLETYRNINSAFWAAFEKGEIEKSEIYAGRFKKWLAAIGSDKDPAAAAEYYGERLGGYSFAIDGALPLIEKLKNEGYDIHIVTNGKQSVQKRRIIASGLAKTVNKIFLSEDIGAPKPDKMYFDYVFAHIAEKDKTKILIIGDNIGSDIIGGINAGIDTCWYNPKNKTSDIKPTYEIKELSEILKVLD